jgi:hypothetical protein
MALNPQDKKNTSVIGIVKCLTVPVLAIVRAELSRIIGYGFWPLFSVLSLFSTLA